MQPQSTSQPARSGMTSIQTEDEKGVQETDSAHNGLILLKSLWFLYSKQNSNATMLLLLSIPSLNKQMHFNSEPVHQVEKNYFDKTFILWRTKYLFKWLYIW